MRSAALAIGIAAALAACSEPVATRDVSGVYTGTLGDGQAYRLEMGEDMEFRFCAADEPECTPSLDRGRYEVVRLGSISVVEFQLLCITFEDECRAYEADTKLRRPGSVEIAFVDHAGAIHVFEKQR